jgi:hypothetical protein
VRHNSANVSCKGKSINSCASKHPHVSDSGFELTTEEEGRVCLIVTQPI